MMTGIFRAGRSAPGEGRVAPGRSADVNPGETLLDAPPRKAGDLLFLQRQPGQHFVVGRVDVACVELTQRSQELGGRRVSGFTPMGGLTQVAPDEDGEEDFGVGGGFTPMGGLTQVAPEDADEDFGVGVWQIFHLQSR